MRGFSEMAEQAAVCPRLVRSRDLRQEGWTGMATRESVVALVREGTSYGEAAHRLGILAGLAYLIATGNWRKTVLSHTFPFFSTLFRRRRRQALAAVLLALTNAAGGLVHGWPAPSETEGTKSSQERRKELEMPPGRSSVKNERQYEALRDKGMSKERAARIANSPNASHNGGKSSGSGGNAKQGGTTAQHKAAGRKGGQATGKKQ